MTDGRMAPLPGDLVVHCRAALNIRTGRKEPRYFVDDVSVYRPISFATQTEALKAGRRQAAAAGVALWEDVTSPGNPTRTWRLEVSFRVHADSSAAVDESARPE